MHVLDTLNIDFSGRRASPGLLGIALACAGVIATAWVIDTYLSESQQIDLWESKLHEIKKMSRRTPSTIAEPLRDSRELQQEVRIANTVLRQIAVPWDTLFREIEKSGGESVALLSVQPDVQNRAVRITGEAKNLQAMLDYIRRLEATRSLSDIVLTGHEIKAQDAQRPVNFSLVAVWADKR